MRRWVSLLLVIFLLAACGDPATRAQTAAPRQGLPVVLTVNYPLAYFAERIGAEDVEVRLPVPPGIDPAWWTPDDDALSAYQEADVVLLNGATYAKWVEKSSLPASRLIDTSKAARDRYVTLDDVVTHAHGPEGAHQHHGLAFTTWLDPEIALAQAQATKDALVRLVPGKQEQMEARHAALSSDLRALGERWRSAVQSDPDRAVVFSHPVYQYLRSALGIHGEPVHWEPDAMPEEATWAEFEASLADRPARWMIWERQPLGPVVDRLEKLGLMSVVFDPAGGRPAQGDFLTVMQSNAEALEKVFGS